MEGITYNDEFSLRNKVLGMYSPVNFNETEIEHILHAQIDATAVAACNRTPGLAVIDTLNDWGEDMVKAALVKLNNLHYLPVVDVRQQMISGTTLTYFETPHPTQRLAMVRNTGQCQLQMGLNVKLRVPRHVSSDCECVVSFHDANQMRRRYIIFPETYSSIGIDETHLHHSLDDQSPTKQGEGYMSTVLRNIRMINEYIKLVKVKSSAVNPTVMLEHMYVMKSIFSEFDSNRVGIFYGDYEHDNLQRNYVESGEKFNILMTH